MFFSKHIHVGASLTDLFHLSSLIKSKGYFGNLTGSCYPYTVDMSSILIKVGTSNTSLVVGKLSVNDAESCSNGDPSDGPPSSLENFRREIRIVLENPDEEVYR